MFADETEEDPQYDLAPFVGRDSEREAIKQLLGHVARAVQLTGQPMVGKARLAEKISNELQDEMTSKGKKLLCYHMCCRGVSCLSDLLACLSGCLSLNDTAETEAALIKNFQAIVANDIKCFHLFVLLKCEDVHKNNFYVQFMDIVKKFMEVSKKVFVIITTQKPFNITLARQTTIQPLSKEDTVMLVRRYAPNADVDIYKDAIEKHCYGLPPLAMDAALELVKAKDIPYTPEEFDDLLSAENRSMRIHSNNDILNAEAAKQFEGLSEFLKQRVVDISIFKGSFRVDDVLSMLGNTRVEAKRNLNEMKSTGLVEYEDGGQRMRLQAVIGHYVRNLTGSHVGYDDAVRMRFVTLFVDVLKKADTELFIKPQQTVFGYLHDDWPNLKQVLEEAIHCTQDTYPAFLQVAMSAENLLVKCFPGEAITFYEAMMYSASKFGTREECAVQKWLLGMAKTIGKGTDLVDAMGLFKEALPILRQAENSESLVSLLADMGLNYNRQGKNTKSRYFYQQALEESGRCCDGRKLINRLINIRCYLAIPLIFLECYDEAENLLNETLNESKKCAPYHPSIPIMINSLGLIYERAGKGDDEALHYYTNSLTERRKYAQVAPGDLVVVLNNVGMQHSKRGNNEYALQLLSEAREIRMKIDRINYHTALTCWNMGQVFARKGETKNALSEIKDALEIFKKCTKDHFVIVEVSLLAAHLAAILEQYQDAEDYLLDALKMEEKFKVHAPSSVHILLVLQHLVMVYLAWKPKCSPFLDRAVAEVTRLADLCRPYESLDRYNSYMEQKETMCRIRAEIDQQRVSGHKLDELLQEMMGFCYQCGDFKSRGENILAVIHSMTTYTCDSLARAQTLLRSESLRVAAQVLRNASGISDSPPVSPTQELPELPSFYMNDQVLIGSREDSSDALPFVQDRIYEAMHRIPTTGAPTYSDTVLRHDQTYLKHEMETNPVRTQYNTENVDTLFESSCPGTPSCPERLPRKSPLTYTEHCPESAGRSGYEFEQNKTEPGSLGINVTILQGLVKSDDAKGNESPKEKNIVKLKTVDDTSPTLYQKQTHFPNDPTVRFPPCQAFPASHRLSHPGQGSAEAQTNATEMQKEVCTLSHITNMPPHQSGNYKNTQVDFHAKYARHASVVASLKNPVNEREFASAALSIEGGDIPCGKGGRPSTSSGYDSSTNAPDGSRVNKRLSECSQVSSAESSGACSKSASQHDDRHHGSKTCCNQPGCFCSISRVPLT